MRRDSLLALLGDFVGLHNSPAYKPPSFPPTESAKVPEKLKKKRAASMYCADGDLPPTSDDNHLKPPTAYSQRRQSEPAIKHSPRHHKSRKTSTASQRSSTTISSNPASELSSDGSESQRRGSRRGSDTFLGSIAVFSKPLVVINGRM